MHSSVNLNIDNIPKKQKRKKPDWSERKMKREERRRTKKARRERRNAFANTIFEQSN